jgi:hypothetical protein
LAQVENEWLTRKKRIDTRLKALHWKIRKHTPTLDITKIDKTLR